jgi:hypothetical protein
VVPLLAAWKAGHGYRAGPSPAIKFDPMLANTRVHRRDSLPPGRIVCGRCSRLRKLRSELAVVTVEAGHVIVRPIRRLSKQSAERRGVPRDNPERTTTPLRSTTAYELHCRTCRHTWRVSINQVTRCIREVPEGTLWYVLAWDDRSGTLRLDSTTPAL